MAASGGLWYYFEKENLLQKINFEMETAINRLSNNLSSPVWNLDEDEIRKVIGLEMNNQDIIAIMMTSGIGIKVSKIGKVRLSPDRIVEYTPNAAELDKSFIRLHRQILYKGIFVGTVETYATDAYMKRYLNTVIIRFLLQIVLSSLPVGIILFLSIRKLILKPLMILEKGADYLREQNFGVMLEVSSEDEIGKLTQAFNQMSAQIRKDFEDIRQSEKKFGGLLERLNEAVYRMSVPDGKYEYCSPAALKVFGYGADEFLNTPMLIKHIIHPEFYDYFVCKCDEMMHGRVSPVCEYKIIDPKGRERWVFQTNTGVFDDDGNIIALESCCSDITDRKNAEQIKAELEERLKRSEKMESLGLLAGGVAHDLNNVLSGIVSYPDVLLMRLPHDSPLRKPIMMIQQSGLRAAAIVQDLLTLARRCSANHHSLNLNDMVKEYLDTPEHQTLLQTYPDVIIETSLASDLLNIKGSPIHLRKTVMNLIYNAAEAQPDGGKIIISTKNEYLETPIRGYDDIREGEFAVLRIEDQGVGIAPHDLKRIFEPFYTRKIMGRSGTGLGMAVVWGTVQDHQGYIDVQSREGCGTVFELFFPISREQVSSEKQKISSDIYRGNGEHILIVDDIEEQREIAAKMLEMLGYSVISISSGEEAVEYIRNHKADLVVLDMIMESGMDGLRTYQKIIKINPIQKAIITSGFSETDRVREAQRLGAGKYVRKPYTLESFGMAVKEELKK
jgi:PAS domain S-box-containing protein